MLKRYLLPDAAPRPTQAVTTPVEALVGVPVKDLTHLFRFTETSLSAGVKDDVTGVSYMTSGALGPDANNVEAMQAGGGLKLTGRRQINLPTLDPRQPWTVIGAITVPLPGTSKATGIMALSEAATRGFMVYDLSPSTASRTNDVFARYYVRTVSGTPQAPVQQVPPAASRYDRCNFFVFLHDGLGNFRIEERIDNRQAYQTFSVDPDTLAGPGGSKVYNLALVLGGFYPLGTMSTSGIIVDAVAMYGAAKSEQELVTAKRAMLDLARTRGRG